MQVPLFYTVLPLVEGQLLGNVWLTHSVAAGSQILQSPNESYQKSYCWLKL